MELGSIGELIPIYHIRELWRTLPVFTNIWFSLFLGILETPFLHLLQFGAT